MSSTYKHLYNLLIRHNELKENEKDIVSAFIAIRDTFIHKGKLLIVGNGGSAADAEHIVGELGKSFILPRNISPSFANKIKSVSPNNSSFVSANLQNGLPAISLMEQTGLSSACLNDMNATMIYAQKVNVYGDRNDTLLAISTSGCSKNIIYASIIAKAKDMHVIGLTGSGNNDLEEYCDTIIKAPSTKTYIVQEMHAAIYHTLCLMLEEEFFGSSN